jgi:hypothetical protein
LTIPLLVRWMLVLEDSDEDRLYVAKGIPREWTGSGKPIRIDGAPTRWGKVSFNMASSAKIVHATVELERAGAPQEIQVKIRLPKHNSAGQVSVNGRAASLGGPNSDTVIITTEHEKKFEVAVQFS